MRYMTLLTLKPHQKIVVYSLQDDQPYQSRIEDVFEDEIYIAIPLSESSPLALKTGDYITVRLPLDTHCLEFTTQVVGMKLDSIPWYVINYPESIQRVQLRQDVRIDILLDVLYSTIPEAGADPEYKKAAAVNFSAGGIRIAVREPLQEDTLLLIKFNLPVKGSVHFFEMESKIVRCQLVESKDQAAIYHLGLAFHNIHSKQKDFIYQFIFQRMSQMKRLGRF